MKVIHVGLRGPRKSPVNEQYDRTLDLKINFFIDMSYTSTILTGLRHSHRKVHLKRDYGTFLNPTERQMSVATIIINMCVVCNSTDKTQAPVERALPWSL